MRDPASTVATWVLYGLLLALAVTPVATIFYLAANLGFRYDSFPEVFVWIGRYAAFERLSPTTDGFMALFVGLVGFGGIVFLPDASGRRADRGLLWFALVSLLLALVSIAATGIVGAQQFPSHFAAYREPLISLLGDRFSMYIFFSSIGAGLEMRHRRFVTLDGYSPAQAERQYG